MIASLRMIRAAVTRRRLPTLVIAVVALLSTATVVLGVGLLVVSDAPFDHAFTRQAGAHVAASFDRHRVTQDALRATASRPGVTAMAGPFDLVDLSVAIDGRNRGVLSLAGRDRADGDVDRLTIDKGHWLTGPGQVVLSRDAAGPTPTGVTLTVTGPAGPVSLQVVGIADSVTGTADGWVWPGQAGVLSGNGSAPTSQVLYRFAAAGSDKQVAASLSTATAGLPPRALLGSASYLTAKRTSDSSVGPVVPFVVAFAVLGLVLSVLIVANVVGGAVVAGYRTIGVLKALGFSPGQIVAVYSGQTVLPGVVGCLVGVPLGNLMAIPLLAQADRAYDFGSAGQVAVWVDLVAVLGLPVIIALAAIAPALRAGRLAAVEAINIGRAPQLRRGQRVRQLLSAARLPVPLRFGLGTPFTRPARTVGTLLAVLLGATTVVFAVGLSSSLSRVAAANTRSGSVPIEILRPFTVSKSGPLPAAGPIAGSAGLSAAQLATIKAQAGTARMVGEIRGEVRLTGVTGQVVVTGYDGDSSWLGYPLISGRWYTGPGEVVAGSELLRSTGHRLGDTVTLTGGRGHSQVRIVGEAFGLDGDGMALVTDLAGLNGLIGQPGPSGSASSTQPLRPGRYEVGLTAGTDPVQYARELTTKLGSDVIVAVRAETEGDETFKILLALIATLTVLLGAVAALGVFNAAVLDTRERVHDVGVLKTLGMTPRQVRVAVVASMAGVGLVAGLIAVPFGTTLHRLILPAMAGAANTGIPASFLDVYRPVELASLAAAGIALAVIGALIPAGWAARTRIAPALRTE